MTLIDPGVHRGAAVSMATELMLNVLLCELSLDRRHQIPKHTHMQTHTQTHTRKQPTLLLVTAET